MSLPGKGADCASQPLAGEQSPQRQNSDNDLTFGQLKRCLPESLAGCDQLYEQGLGCVNTVLLPPTIMRH